MKNFLDLLATNFSIDICIKLIPSVANPVKVIVNEQCIYDNVMTHPTELHYSVPLLTPIDISINHAGTYLKSLCFDGWEARPQHAQDANNVWQFKIDKPFYQWQHWATSQGWLLLPC